MTANINPRIDLHVQVGNLAPRNFYESQILAYIPNWSGNRIRGYSWNDNCKDARHELMSLKGEWNVQQAFFSKKKLDENYGLDPSTFFETDFYFQTEDSVGACADLLDGCTYWLKQLPGMETKKQVMIGEGEWIFIEIAESPTVLPQKLYQLERATRFIPEIDPQIKPKALVVLLNGLEGEAQFAIDNVSVPNQSILRKYPVYVGWVPTRNIFKIMVDQGKQLDNQRKLLDNQRKQLQEILTLLRKQGSSATDNSARSRDTPGRKLLLKGRGRI